MAKRATRDAFSPNFPIFRPRHCSLARLVRFTKQTMMQRSFFSAFTKQSHFSTQPLRNMVRVIRNQKTYSKEKTKTNAQSTQTVYIVGASRTPIGSLNGSLATQSAPQLGITAVKHALEKSGLKPEQVEEIYMGNVVQAGVGQSPARQVGIGAG